MSNEKLNKFLENHPYFKFSKNFVDLTKSYVVVKIKGDKKYYYGCTYPRYHTNYKHYHNYEDPNNAIIFNSLEAAENKIIELKCKFPRLQFQAEAASNHFLNDFHLSYNTHYNLEFILENYIKPINDKNSKSKLIEDCFSNIEEARKNRYILDCRQESLQFIENYEKIKQEEINDLMRTLEEKLNKHKQKLQYLEKLNSITLEEFTEAFNGFVTQNDLIHQALYASNKE